MPNNDYILRSDAIEALCGQCRFYDSSNDCGVRPCFVATRKDQINAIPAADVEPKRRWISVTDADNLPKKSTPCLVACNQWGGEIVRKAIFLASENCFTERGIDITEYVTHWMESPKPPEGVYNA